MLVVMMSNLTRLGGLCLAIGGVTGCTLTPPPSLAPSLDGRERSTNQCEAVNGIMHEKPFAWDDEGILIIDDDRLRQVFTAKVADMIGDEADDFVAARQEQLERRHFPMTLLPAGDTHMTISELYRNRIDRAVIVGVFYHCSSKRCRRLHSSLSSGVVVHEDGVVLTNYHVVDVEQPRFLAMAVMTLDGRVYLVGEVLATDPAHDVAAVKLEGANGLAAAPIRKDEPVGAPVTLITHPKGNFYSLTSGVVSRYCMGTKSNVVMNVTADYAVGSSGGPVFNAYGDVVGLVSSTTSIAARHMRLDAIGQTLQEDASNTSAIDGPGGLSGDSVSDDDVPKSLAVRKTESKNKKRLVVPTQHQMTLKNAVPSRAILALFSDEWCVKKEEKACEK